MADLVKKTFAAMNMLMYLPAMNSPIHKDQRHHLLVREVEQMIYNVERCFSKTCLDGGPAPVVHRCLLARWLKVYGLQPVEVALLTCGAASQSLLMCCVLFSAQRALRFLCRTGARSGTCRTVGALSVGTSRRLLP